MTSYELLEVLNCKRGGHTSRICVVNDPDVRSVDDSGIFLYPNRVVKCVYFSNFKRFAIMTSPESNTKEARRS